MGMLMLVTGPRLWVVIVPLYKCINVCIRRRFAIMNRGSCGWRRVMVEIWVWPSERMLMVGILIVVRRGRGSDGTIECGVGEMHGISIWRCDGRG